MPWPSDVPVPREVFRLRPRHNDVIVFRVHPEDAEAFDDPQALESLADMFDHDVRVVIIATHHPIEIDVITESPPPPS